MVVFVVMYIGIDGEEALTGIFSKLAPAMEMARRMNVQTKERYDVRGYEVDSCEWVLWHTSKS